MKTQKNPQKIIRRMVPRSVFLRRAAYPANRHDTCGYTAACFLLLYYHRTYGGFISPEYLTSKGQLKTEGYTLQDRLIQYGTSNLSWGGSIARVLNLYFKDHAIKAKAHFRMFGFFAHRYIRNKSPIIVFGNMPAKNESRINHAVFAYGVEYQTKHPKLIVHYGWKGWERKLLEDAVIGSYVFLEVFQKDS